MPVLDYIEEQFASRVDRESRVCILYLQSLVPNSDLHNRISFVVKVSFYKVLPSKYPKFYGVFSCIQMRFSHSKTQVERGDLSDTLVHVCIFFIPPTGHGLKPLDVEFMKKIHDKVFRFYFSKYNSLLI